jgi:hypothetical protein
MERSAAFISLPSIQTLHPSALSKLVTWHPYLPFRMIHFTNSLSAWKKNLVGKLQFILNVDWKFHFGHSRNRYRYLPR